MDEAVWFSIVEVPGYTWEDGSNLYRTPKDRILPDAILVNGTATASSAR